MPGQPETLHVAWGTSRAESVRDALRLRGCGSRVIALTRALDLGPIASREPRARRAWFAANTRCHEEPDGLSDDPEAPWTDATAVGIHPVFWVCLTDAAEHACFLEFASRMAGRPFDIVDATGFDLAGTGRGSPIWSLGQMRPEEIAASGLALRRRPFTGAESDAAVAAWSQLRREDAPLRVVRGGRLVSAPLTHVDEIVLGQAARHRELLIALIGRVLHHLAVGQGGPGQGCSDEFLFARILALGESGALEVTGPGPGMRDYEVRLPGDPA